jgi:deazaflavin-dependent oxidoreductase (nitroreductase family)
MHRVPISGLLVNQRKTHQNKLLLRQYGIEIESGFVIMVPLVNQPSPTGILRLLLRFPIWLYRVHLGWLLNDRFLLLTHRGRNSGLTRQTVVEVVQHDAASGVYFIASGWGEQAHWLRDIQKTPEVIVQVGRQAFIAMAERLSADAAQRVLLANAQCHPVVFRLLAKLMTGRSFRNTEQDYQCVAYAIPVIALRPREELRVYNNKLITTPIPLAWGVLRVVHKFFL